MIPITTAKHFLSKDIETQEDLLRRQTERAHLFYRDSFCIITSGRIIFLCDRIKEQTGVSLNHDQLQKMLMDMFGYARTELFRNGVDDTASFEILLNSLASFLVGTTYLDDEAFHKLMVKQSEALGFQKGVT